MFLSYQYRLYPIRAQLPVLFHELDELTYLRNHALAERPATPGRRRGAALAISTSRRG